MNIYPLKHLILIYEGLNKTIRNHTTTCALQLITKGILSEALSIVIIIIIIIVYYYIYCPLLFMSVCCAVSVIGLLAVDLCLYVVLFV
jgi:hypothetical protein